MIGAVHTFTFDFTGTGGGSGGDSGGDSGSGDGGVDTDGNGDSYVASGGNPVVRFNDVTLLESKQIRFPSLGPWGTCASPIAYSMTFKDDCSFAIANNDDSCTLRKQQLNAMLLLADETVVVAQSECAAPQARYRAMRGVRHAFTFQFTDNTFLARWVQSLLFGAANDCLALTLYSFLRSVPRQVGSITLGAINHYLPRLSVGLSLLLGSVNTCPVLSFRGFNCFFSVLSIITCLAYTISHSLSFLPFVLRPLPVVASIPPLNLPARRPKRRRRATEFASRPALFRAPIRSITR
jgi:hypothetical protein